MRLHFERRELHLVSPWATSRTFGARSVTVVELSLHHDGFIGRGEATPIERYRESIGKVEAFLAKIDPNRLSVNDIVASMFYLSSLACDCMSAKSAVNMALLDLQAKREQRTVFDTLGLEFYERRYLSSFTLGMDEQAVIARKAAEASNYPILKLKVGASQDKANFKALRQVAPTKPIRLDANEGWETPQDALEMIEWFAADARVQFVEQPMPSTSARKDWIWLKERSPLPIFADESYHGAPDAAPAAECFHGVNVKLAKTGGISAAVSALEAAREQGLKTMLGCMVESSLPISAAAHLASLCDYLDLDGSLLITNDPFCGVSVTNGQLSFLSAPERFGLRVSPRSIQNNSQK